MLAEILNNIDELTDTALSMCTTVLVNVVEENPDLVGSGESALQVASALSNVLSKGLTLSDSVRTEVEDTLSTLSIAAQSDLAVGEDPVDFVLDAMKVKVAVGTYATLLTDNFTAPQTDFEVFDGINPPTVSMNMSESNLDTTANSALGVSLVQYDREAGGVRSGNVTSIELQTQYYSDFTARRRRLRNRRLSTTEEEDGGGEMTAVEEGQETMLTQRRQFEALKLPKSEAFIGKNGFIIDNLPTRRSSVRHTELSSSQYSSDAGNNQRERRLSAVALQENEVYDDSTIIDSSSHSRRLSSLTDFDLGANVVLYNTDYINYTRIDQVQVQSICYGIDGKPYDQSGFCHNTNTYFTITCPGKVQKQKER